MENQGNMQSGKKAAVIYFLAAFFIACIGIAGANYLKGELGLSAEELVKKVELTVEIAVLLGIAIAVRHLLKKRNRKIAGIIVFLFVAGVFSWQNSGIWQESQLKPQRLETPESEFDRYDIKDGHFTVAEANANIVKEINVDYLDNVTVHFSKPVTQKVIVRVLYETKTQHGFDNKTRKMRVKVHKGETVGCVSMKVKDVTRIKIGIGRKIGTQFDYGYTEINGNYAARMHQKKVSMAKYFVLFMLIPAGYFILAAGKKWQEKTDKNICLRILSFPFGFITILSLFATFLVVNLVEWVKMTCGNVSFSIILLQLTSPIKGTDSGIINSIKKQDFYEDTTIIIAGDHTSMVDTGSKFWKSLSNDYQRTVYNAIINPQCAYKKKVTTKRKFSIMDMFPTTLAALGVEIDGNKLGLGTNLFSGEETLREELGANYINKELKRNDKMYNQFY